MEPVSITHLWTGRTLSGLAIAFLLVDAFGKLLKIAPVMDATRQIGYPESTVLPIGVLLMIGVVLYAIPRTSVIGAIYLSGFLGGAVAAHLRIGSPLFTHVLFSIYVAAFVWGGLVLRSPRVLQILLGK